MATALEQSSSKSDDNISYAQWIKYFLKFSVLKNKSKGGDDKAKKCARDTILSLIQTKMNITVTDEQIRKSFNNKKTRLMAKVDRRKTGNVTETLTDDEKLFEPSYMVIHLTILEIHHFWKCPVGRSLG